MRLPSERGELAERGAPLFLAGLHAEPLLPTNEKSSKMYLKRKISTTRTQRNGLSPFTLT